MGKKTTLTLALSQEELFVVLQYLNRPPMAGLDVEILNELNERERRLVFGVAERALIARGFLTGTPQKRFQLAAPVLALLATCTDPEKSIVVTLTRADGPEEQYFFHTARKMRVMHIVPITTIHQFIAVEDDLALGKAVLSSINLGNGDAATPGSGTIEMSTLMAARGLAIEKKIDQAVETLASQLESSTAKLLVAALADPVSNATIACISQGKENTAGGFSYLRGQQSQWLIEPIDSGDASSGKVSVQSVTSGIVTQRVKDMLK